MVGNAGQSERLLPNDDPVPKPQGVRPPLFTLPIVEDAPRDNRKVPRPGRDRRDAVQQATRKASRSSQPKTERVLNVGRRDVIAPAQQDRRCLRCPWHEKLSSSRYFREDLARSSSGQLPD